MLKRRKAARLRHLRQGLQHLVIPQHTQTDTQRGEAAPVSTVRQEVHGFIQPLLPQDDAQQGLESSSFQNFENCRAMELILLNLVIQKLFTKITRTNFNFEISKDAIQVD